MGMKSMDERRGRGLPKGERRVIPTWKMIQLEKRMDDFVWLEISRLGCSLRIQNSQAAKMLEKGFNNRSACAYF
jgi:hypothetical protein